MAPAFWDSSALVPLCVQKQASATVRRLLRKHEMVVWWATPMEMRSAFARLLRTGHLMPAEFTAAKQGLDQLRRAWRELQPTDQLRAEAEMLVDRFPLKAADALQLAAALTWASGEPSTHVFVSGDTQLLQAARQCGFQVVQV